MPWVILRTVSGERFLCQTEANLVDAVTNRRTVKVTNVYAVTTVSMMTQMGQSRMTALEYPDLQEEKPLEYMHVLPSAWYPFPDERAEKEIGELEHSMEKAKEYQKEMQQRMESDIIQARLTPQGGPPMPGAPFPLGNLTKPPGVR
jgi:hypothetical protein